MRTPDPADLDVLFEAVRRRLGNGYVFDGAKLLGDPMREFPDIRAAAEKVAGFAFGEIVWQDGRARKFFETERMRRWAPTSRWRLATLAAGWLRIEPVATPA